jgi:hypothetical protein
MDDNGRGQDSRGKLTPEQGSEGDWGRKEAAAAKWALVGTWVWVANRFGPG